MAKTQKVLQPQYVQKFQCTGGDCEDNCCSGWYVSIDKATYELYRKCPDAKTRHKLDKKITRNRISSTNDNYAKIKMDIDECCPFWDEDKLCSLQRSMGEKYLSITCAGYPRHYKIVNGILEKSLHLSCPEATRLALLNTHRMEFDITEETAHIRKSTSKILDKDDAKKNHKPEQYFSELRSFTIALLQNRLYPLWKRLVILGLFYDNLNNLIAENKTSEILPLITTYLEHLKLGVFRDRLDTLPNKLNVQITIIRRIAANRAAIGSNKHFTECFGEAMKGINYSEELPEEELSAQYDLAYKNYYQPFASKHEYILENYLVSYVFSDLFPFESEKNVFDSYIMLIIHYALIKTVLIGMAGFHKEKFNTDYMLKLIHSLTKVTTHNPIYLKSVGDCLKSNNMDNMAYMSILIKN